MQTLKLANHVFDQLDKGKRVTIRYGYRTVSLGALKFESYDDREETVDVVKVLHCHFNNIPPEYVINEGTMSSDELLGMMREFYPSIEYYSEVTCIEFNTKVKP